MKVECEGAIGGEWKGYCSWENKYGKSYIEVAELGMLIMPSGINVIMLKISFSVRNVHRSLKKV